MTFKRNCPKCKCEILYTDKRNCYRANKKNSNCNKCTIRHTPKSIEKLRLANSGKKYFNRKSNKWHTNSQYFRMCPECNIQMGYDSKYSRDRANKQISVCNRCSCKLYKKSWEYIIKDVHIKQMAATKAGYNSYSEYMNDLDNKKKYYREVRRITRLQPINKLENYEKMRGLCGINNAYQLDHIISISEGYSNNISPEIIGNIKNLQIIPWQKNLIKSNT